jgi:hypothetical protein
MMTRQLLFRSIAPFSFSFLFLSRRLLCKTIKGKKEEKQEQQGIRTKDVMLFWGGGRGEWATRWASCKKPRA